MSWRLECPWCAWYIQVGDRGGRDDDQGAGVESAQLMEGHARNAHGKTWAEYLTATITCDDCRHRRHRHLDQSSDPAKVRAGGAHPCLDCLACRGFVEAPVRSPQ